jgi:osmoprotectant transport system permease protein
MDFLVDALAWLSDVDHWRGAAGIPVRTLEHVRISAFAIGCAALVAVPLGVLLGHLRRGGVAAVAVVNIGRALPSFAVLSLAFLISLRIGLGLGFWPTFAALFLLAMPPMFTNSYTGVREVPADVVEAARAMGMRTRSLLVRVELPMAAPVIMASIRVAAVQVVATATLGALVGFGGLGRYIVDGLALRDFPQVFAGALVVAVLSILTEVGLSAGERVMLPEGVRRLSGAPEPSGAEAPA